MPNISKLAIIEPGAELADDVIVGPFSYIGAQVKIAAGCIIDNNATITGRTNLCEKTHVFPMAVVGAPACDCGAGSSRACGAGVPPAASAKRHADMPPGYGQCIIGKANAIREHVVIYAGLEKPTRIGDDNLIMIGGHVGAGAIIGDHGIFANGTLIDAAACVEDYVRSSAFAVVKPGMRVGAYTFIAGFVAIDHDAPPYAIIQGVPFRVRGVNTENLKRCGFGESDIRALKDAFRELFDGPEFQISPASLKKFLAEGVNPHVRHLAQTLQAIGGAKGRP